MKKKMPFRLTLPVLLFFVCLLPVSQVKSQTLRGVVREADNSQPITGATVNLYASRTGGTPVALATTPDGEFLFEKLRAGYYHGEVIAQGFETVYFTEVLIAAGKEQVLDIALRRTASPLPEVTIAATLPGRRLLQPMSEIPLTRDQTLRFPAMFFDPGRLAAAYPGVLQTDDGINGMSIRGNSPATVRWRLEGLDIVNPNHLPNAGTISDAPAAASGGVLMFSAQMLDNSSLLTGAFPAGYGDATSGVMDMNLRAGNARRHEFTAQAGLVGLDLAAEGPLKQGKNDNSYLVNYRYSTVGLLGQLGVSFGDEQINFQDLSYHLHLNGKKGGQYSIFGLGGLSENVFHHKADTTEVKYDKDRYDIDFQSKTGVLGGSGRWKLAERSWLKAALVYSVQFNDWHKRFTPYPDSLSSDERTEERIAASLEWKKAFRHHQVTAGLQASRIYFKAYVFQVLSAGPFTSAYLTPYNRDLAYTNLQPWLRWDWTAPNGRWNTQVGMQFHYNNIVSKLAPAPRGTLAYRISQHHKIALNAGLYKQDAPIWMQYLTPRFSDENFRPPYISSFQTGLRYTWTPSLFWKVGAEFFHQHTDNIPATSTSALVNTPEYISEFPTTKNAQSRNYGVEISVERSLQSGWFFVANATLFRSKYKMPNQVWQDSKWDIGHLSNITFGKEWLREKSANLVRTIGVGIRGVWAGGPREADIDLTLSDLGHRTILDESKGYYRRYPDYFRADLRVYWKRSLGDRRNSTFALDIQNVSGQQNLAYHFYDSLTKRIENKYQLGPIPNFSWRLEF